jgi:spoIIIJ-associated protein
MDKISIVKQETEELLKKMIDSFEVTIEEEEGAYHAIIKTDEEASTVIGRHGETIRAIQKILEVILYRKLGEGVDILINVNDYREKQKERLEHIAGQIAEKVQSMHRSSHLRGFSSYERKIIHEFITQNFPDLSTYSVGEGRDRQLVVDLKGNEPESHDEE